MSFAIAPKANTKTELLARVRAEFAGIEATQPIHAKDLPAIEEAVARHLALLPNPGPSQEYVTSISGSCQTTNGVLQGVNMSVGIYLATLQVPQHHPV